MLAYCRTSVSLQVFGVEEQEALCVSRLGVTDQRERLASQRSGTTDRGKPGRLEAEVHELKSVKFKRKKLFHHSSTLFKH